MLEQKDNARSRVLPQPFSKKLMTAAASTRLVIADDHPLFRDGLTALLTDGPDTELTGAATSGTEAVDLARETQPDVVVMDLHMPGLNGIEATRRIVADSPHITVLVLTMFDDDDSIFSALRAGARGYLLKGADQEQIRAAIRAAANGEMMTSYYREDITGLPEMGVVAARLWRDSGLKPQDIQTAFIYDHFTPFVFTQFEELGFCGRGEAKDFATVERLSLGGELPINTNGGLLGEAYIHGMNGIAEGVRQVRGTSVNQVPGVEHVLVTAGTMVPTSALIVGVDN